MMSNIADVLMDAQREREDRDRKLRSALTLGDLRRIVNNITTDRDNVPVVLPNDREGTFYPVVDWRGERWHGSNIAEGNVFALYSD
jgi:hypothetical protein